MRYTTGDWVVMHNAFAHSGVTRDLVPAGMYFVMYRNDNGALYALYDPATQRTVWASAHTIDADAVTPTKMEALIKYGIQV